MILRFTVAFIILTIFGCALLASYQHQPNEMRIDGPKHAASPIMPGAMICKPILYPRHPAPGQIVRT